MKEKSNRHLVSFVSILKKMVELTAIDGETEKLIKIAPKFGASLPHP